MHINTVYKPYQDAPHKVGCAGLDSWKRVVTLKELKIFLNISSQY